MNLRKLLAVGVIAMQLMNNACAKIDKYNSPHMLEGFTGVVKITPGIKGITAKTYSPGLIFFNGNKGGTEVVMYGPNTENISLYSILPEGGNYKDDKGITFREYLNKFKKVNTLDKLDFSGFRAHVDPSNGKKATFYDFGDQSDGMKKFKWIVKGEGLIDGPETDVRITISTTVGVLQDLLPADILLQLGAPNSDVSLKEFEDREAVVFLAQIRVLATALTIAN